MKQGVYLEQESNLRNAYFEAYRIACEKLAKCNVNEICQNSKAVFERRTNSYTLKYFGAEYNVDCINGAISLKDSSDEVKITEKVLILHYLINSKPEPLIGRYSSFMEIPAGGSIYYSSFKKRAIDPIVKVFSNNLQTFDKAATYLHGVPANLGSVSTTINVFSMIPITYVIWQGDDEIESSGTILFDASIINFLPAEDIALAASFGSYKLIEKSNEK
jgi:hypothetical protein